MEDSKSASIKFHHLVITRAPGLLPMLYSPQEIGQELGISSRTVREWIDKGMPYQRDNRGHIWINGSEFADWVEQERTVKKHVLLKDDQAFCLHCKQPVQFAETQRIQRGKLTLLQGKCPTCGRTIIRGRHFDQPN